VYSWNLKTLASIVPSRLLLSREVASEKPESGNVATDGLRCAAMCAADCPTPQDKKRYILEVLDPVLEDGRRGAAACFRSGAGQVMVSLGAGAASHVSGKAWRSGIGLEPVGSAGIALS